MPNMDSLEDLLQDEIKDIYDAEKQLIKALPKLIKKATNEELKEALAAHLQETEQHAERLEQVFEQFGLPTRGKRCEGMQHLIAEGSDMIAACDDDDTRDAVIIAAAQKCEHYEIASYGTIRVWANLLGKNDAGAILEETLNEEKEADLKLTGIAEGFVNEAAAERGDEEEEEKSTGSRPVSPKPGRQVAADKGRSSAARRSR
jgi:ferritin-like metal-binding protein YciE